MKYFSSFQLLAIENIFFLPPMYRYRKNNKKIINRWWNTVFSVYPNTRAHQVTYVKISRGIETEQTTLKRSYSKGWRLFASLVPPSSSATRQEVWYKWGGRLGVYNSLIFLFHLGSEHLSVAPLVTWLLLSHKACCFSPQERRLSAG